MSELTPLISSTEDELELLLLRSAEEDEPKASALPKVAAALGLGASVGLVATAVVAEKAVAGGAAVTKPLTLVSVLKWLGAGMTAGALAGGGAHVAFRPSRAGTVAPAAAVAQAPAPGELRQVPRPVVPPPPAAPEEAKLAEEEAPVRSTAPSPRAAAAPAPAVTGAPLGSTASFDAPAPTPATTSTPLSLSEEVAALDAARRELAAGRARSALGAIDAYRARFPAGALRAEATVLRVEALLGSGDRAGAEREASVIVRAAPESRHAARVLDLLGR